MPSYENNQNPILTEALIRLQQMIRIGHGDFSHWDKATVAALKFFIRNSQKKNAKSSKVSNYYDVNSTEDNENVLTKSPKFRNRFRIPFIPDTFRINSIHSIHSTMVPGTTTFIDKPNKKKKKTRNTHRINSTMRTENSVDPPRKKNRKKKLHKKPIVKIAKMIDTEKKTNSANSSIISAISEALNEAYEAQADFIDATKIMENSEGNNDEGFEDAYEDAHDAAADFLVAEEEVKLLFEEMKK